MTLTFLAALLCAGLTALNLAVLGIAGARIRRVGRVPDYLRRPPPVTIIRPLCGADAFTEETLASGYVQQLMAGWRESTGLVCSTPIGSRPAGFWAEVECAFLNTLQARWQYVGESVGLGFGEASDEEGPVRVGSGCPAHPRCAGVISGLRRGWAS